MRYIEGFLVAAPTVNKAPYLAMAAKALPMFKEFGALRMVEGWGDDIPAGKLNDLPGAVKATPDETVLFSWIEYPDKATRDTTNAKLMSDPRMQDFGDMPFDGQRMVFGGFAPLLDVGAPVGTGYVDGCVIAVPEANRAAYLDMATTMAGLFSEAGALRVVEGWEDDVPDGTTTDFRRAVLAEPGERVVFSWIEWPSKDARDTGWARLMEDPRMQGMQDRPFDGKRMIFGGFVPILDA